VRKEFPDYQRALQNLEVLAIEKYETRWKTRFGGLTPPEGTWGRTTILPALFDPNPAVYGGAAFGATAAVAGFTLPPRYWRQYFNTTGNQVILQGAGGGEIIPEDYAVAWMGLAFPNKQQLISEVRWQTSDRKFVRVDIEEIESYNKPALVFEEGFLLNEEQAFHLYGYVKEVGYQRIVMLGKTLFSVIDKVLGAPGDAI
jgi:hypothetical protein